MLKKCDCILTRLSLSYEYVYGENGYWTYSFEAAYADLRHLCPGDQAAMLRMLAILQWIAMLDELVLAAVEDIEAEDRVLLINDRLALLRRTCSKGKERCRPISRTDSTMALSLAELRDAIVLPRCFADSECLSRMLHIDGLPSSKHT